MTHIRRRFGPLFSITAITALVILASMPFWSTAVEQWQAYRLSRLLRDATASTREEAAVGLVQLGPVATPWVVRAMDDADPKVRLLACSILPRTDPDQPIPILDAMVAALKDSDVTVRKTVAYQLGFNSSFLAAKAGNEASRRVVEGLRARLSDEAKDVRIAAAYALGSFGLLANPAVPDLAGALSAPDPDLRIAAARSLLRIDPSGSRPRVISALQAMIADSSTGFQRYPVIQILAAEAGEDTTAGFLIPLLKHQDMGMRQAAINHLIDQCPDALATKPALMDVLGDDDGGLRCAAAFYFLEHEPGMASRALETLEEQLLEPRDGSQLPWDIVRALREKSPGSIGPLVSFLTASLGRAESPDRRLNAILTLGVIGNPEAMPAATALRKAASTDNQDIALRATEVLAKIDPKSAVSQIPALLDWIRPEADITLRLTAMSILGELGPAAETAVPALLKIADEEEVRASSAAIAALTRIDPSKAAALMRSIRGGD